MTARTLTRPVATRVADAVAARLAATAPAKINLYLHVTGRRADGYHLLDSLVAFADFGDRVAVRPAADGALSLTVTGEFAAGLDAGDDNLVLAAARALRAWAGGRPGAGLHLVKNLPVAAGLGGGSADAAAALKLLSRHWRLDPPAAVLRGLAAELGADVPACLAGHPVSVTGIGERLARAPVLPPVGLVLANPGRPLATPAVFRALAESAADRPPAPMTAAPANAAELAGALARRGNDLEPAAIALVPEIEVVLAELGRDPDCLLARMSGSGATCFGLYGNVDQARRAARRLARRQPGWWLKAGRIAAPPA